MIPVDNAVILAAGTSSRFAPLSFERPKGLTEVRGEVLIERQIRQLRQAGVPEIIVVTGYKAEQFNYLNERFGVRLVYNPDYLTRNNNASIWAVREWLGNSYICSSDNYFTRNPFRAEEEFACYAGVYSSGETREWCMTEDEAGNITAVRIGGRDAWYMLGHVFWDKAFTHRFCEILTREYDRPETADKLWEQLYIDHIDELHLKLKKYPADEIHEFDTLDELRTFDPSYVTDTRSKILAGLARTLGGSQAEIDHVTAFTGADHAAAGFTFRFRDKTYRYRYQDGKMEEQTQ